MLKKQCNINNLFRKNKHVYQISHFNCNKYYEKPQFEAVTFPVFLSNSQTTLNPTLKQSEYHQMLLGIWGSVLSHASVLV
jgi:hypothetical protein